MSADTYQLRCEDCDHLFDREEAAGPVYECGMCGVTFSREDSADGDSTRCPQCNRFSGKAQDWSCPDCGSADVEEGAFSPPPPPTPQELAAQAQERARGQEQRQRWQEQRRMELAQQLVKWQQLAPVFAGIPADDGRPLSDRALLLAEGGSADLKIGEAERIACRILRRQPSPPPASYSSAGHEEYQRAREERRARWWGPQGLARAFDGLPAREEGARDLAGLLEATFGDLGAIGLGLQAIAWEAIAGRLRDITTTQED